MSSLTCSQISCQGKSFEARQAAGLLLKNNLRATFSSMPPASQQYVKSELLPCIGATNKAIRSTVGTVISVLFQIVRVAGWIELFQALHQCLDSNDLDHMEGAMDAIYKICEDVPEELDVDVPGLPERPINVFMPRLLQFFQSTHAILRKLALGCINQYIVVMPAVRIPLLSLCLTLLNNFSNHFHLYAGFVHVDGSVSSGFIQPCKGSVSRCSETGISP
jgi:hypothetical protein